MIEEQIQEYFTKDMAEIGYSIVEYGLEDVAVNVTSVDGEKVFSLLHVDGNLLPLYSKPVQKYYYNRSEE